jgi:hypothetical protein
MIHRYRLFTFILTVGIGLGLSAVNSIEAGTIPAGTMLIVKTKGSIYTKDIVGKQFTATLEQNLVIKGNVVAPAGTNFIGKIVTSTKFGNSPLSVNLTAVKSGNKLIPIRTTGPIEPQSAERGRRRQVTTRDFVLPPGAKLQFHLAEAVTI